MERKLLVLDIDGTLVNSKKEITPKTKEAIFKIMDAGHLVMIASGRPTPGVRKYVKELELTERGGYCLNFNGALVTDCKTGEKVYEQKIPVSFVPGLYAFAEKHDIGILTYTEDIGMTGEFIKEEGPKVVFGNRMDKYLQLEADINQLDSFLTPDFPGYVTYDPYKILYTIPPEKGEELEAELAALYKGQLEIMRSESFFLEAMLLGIDKGTTLDRIIGPLGIKHENVICCGDGYNDVPMVRYAGIGVAMQNAKDAVKEVADYITEATNDEDGIAEVIEKFIL